MGTGASAEDRRRRTAGRGDPDRRTRRPGPPGGILFTPDTAPWRPRPDDEERARWRRPGEPAEDGAPLGRESLRRWCDEHDVHFPVPSWQLILAARTGGTRPMTVALSRLPPGEFHSLAHLAATMREQADGTSPVR